MTVEQKIKSNLIKKLRKCRLKELEGISENLSEVFTDAEVGDDLLIVFQKKLSVNSGTPILLKLYKSINNRIDPFKTNKYIEQSTLIYQILARVILERFSQGRFIENPDIDFITGKPVLKRG